MTLKRQILWVLVVALAIPVMLFGAYFVQGSFEQFPTDEQQEKARIAAALGFILFAGLETSVVIALLRGRRGEE